MRWSVILYWSINYLILENISLLEKKENNVVLVDVPGASSFAIQIHKKSTHFYTQLKSQAAEFHIPTLIVSFRKTAASRNERFGLETARSW